MIRIRKKDKSLKGIVHLTPSKSISNRLLIIRALCHEYFQISNLATANDTKILEKLLSYEENILNAEDAGTAFRFLTAYLSQKQGKWQLTGTKRMKERPVKILVDALCELGAEISYVEKEGFPPLEITGKKITGGNIEVDGSVSSQYISALLMIAPTLENGLQLKLCGKIFSQAYIEMTLQLMSYFGIKYEWEENTIVIHYQKYVSKDSRVESDWSAASYWYEMAALADDVDLTLVGLNKNSIQGDAMIAELMNQFGVITNFTTEGVRLTKSKVSLPKIFSYNFQSCPDLVQTMAVTCAALNLVGKFSGVKNLRIKETDRLVALQSELKKIGVQSTISDSEFHIHNSKLSSISAKIKTYNDHRMLLSFAPLAIPLKEITFDNADVVKKSYPEFWNDLSSTGFQVEELS